MVDSSKLCLLVALPARLAEEVSWDLVDMGASAVEIRDGTTMTAAAADRAELTAGFGDPGSRQKAKELLQAVLGDEAEISFVDDVDEGWKTRWREFFKPVVLERLQIITPWMQPPRGDRTTITIDPGQAFGTGGHATTQMILEMLERRAAGDALPAEILDLGCGSGILAVAAAKLGAARITAVDIDPESVAATVENASVNGVAERIDAELGEARSLHRTWPLVLANLQLSVFEGAAAEIGALVSPGGEILVSGLLTAQVERILELWPAFEAVEILERGEWAAVSLKRAP